MTRTVMMSTKRRKRTEKWRDDEMKIRIEKDTLSGTAAEIMDQLRGQWGLVYPQEREHQKQA